jgi:uncharacterized protein (DUF983 family)
VADKRSIWTGVKRGLARRCPNCGIGRLFRGYLTVRSPYDTCGADNTVYPSDDFPPYLTILVTGHVLVPLFMWTDWAYEPALRRPPPFGCKPKRLTEAPKMGAEAIK